MPYTDRDLELIRANPDIVIVEDERATGVARLTYGTGHHATVVPRATWTEHDFQAAVVAECDERAKIDPRWGLLAAIPNGQYRHGQRMEPGLRPGYPDLFLACPSGMWHGLFLELKISPQRPRANQMEWMQRLRQRGYRVVVCYDTVESVTDAIANYLGEL